VNNADELTLVLRKPVTPEALTILRSEASRALDDGARALAVDVEDVAILDSQVIAALIAILREVRERGASMHLRAHRQSLLDTLRITGLDQVFTVTEPGATPVRVPAVARAGARLRAGRLVASLATGAFAATSLLGVSGAAASPGASHPKAPAAQAPRENPR
jgi:anti-anti-sigma factor